MVAVGDCGEPTEVGGQPVFPRALFLLGVFLLEVDRRQLPERRVTSARVVPTLDSGEQRRPGLEALLLQLRRSSSSHSRLAKKLWPSRCCRRHPRIPSTGARPSHGSGLPKARNGCGSAITPTTRRRSWTWRLHRQLRQLEAIAFELGVLRAGRVRANRDYRLINTSKTCSKRLDHDTGCGTPTRVGAGEPLANAFPAQS